MSDPARAGRHLGSWFTLAPASLNFVAHASTPFSLAVKEGHLEMVKLLLGRGAKTEILVDDGRMALHHAASRAGSDAIAEALLSKGANPNARDRSGRTPLEVALGMNNTGVAAKLREHGAK